MKKSKTLVIISLVLVLAITAFIPSTFSWYNHEGTLAGDKMSYYRSDLPVSAGTVALETKKYRTDNNKLFYDEKGNKEYQEVVSNGSVAAGATQYYGTTITNSGDAPAYVNLYLQNFSHHPDNYIGTIAPSLTHKGMSSTVHIANKNMVRVYFQVKDTNNWNDANAKRYAVYTTKNGSKNAIRIQENGTGSGKIDNTKDTNNILNGVATYYVDLPGDATEFYFATDGNNSGFNTSDCSVTQNWYRTNTITDIQAEVGYYLTGVADDTTWRAQYATFPIPGGISVKTYFDTATIAAGQKAYITLSKGTNYTGSTAVYESNNTSLVPVNANTGLISAGNISTSSNTVATMTTTITGSLGDTTTVETAVKNPVTLPAAAVALNVKVPGKTQNDEGTWVNGSAEIVWYIENKTKTDTDPGTPFVFDSIYYTK